MVGGLQAWTPVAVDDVGYSHPRDLNSTRNEAKAMNNSWGDSLILSGKLGSSSTINISYIYILSGGLLKQIVRDVQT